MPLVILTVEWWPEHGSGPMWAGGVSLDPVRLLPVELAARVIAWNDSFVDEDMLPIDGMGDIAWIAEGRGLLAEVRAALSASHEVIVTEPWWGELAEEPPTP